jgi:molybdopterin/thiamine biosynthesis adenylyltransferase
MIMVGAIAAVLWGIGMAMGTPVRARWTMIGLLLVVVMTIQLVLPDGHPLRQATGGNIALWALIGVLAAVVAGYSRLLKMIRNKVAQAELPDLPVAAMSQTEVARYARHIMLREVGGPGQTALREARVLVVGAGGLGSAALQYLAAAGVGTIGVIDDDVVENANLQRQVIHRDADIGLPKVHSAAAAMRAQNPFVTVKPYHRRLDAAVATDLLADYDIVLDGSDNFATRYLVNDVAVAAGKPLIAGALTQWEGQLSVYDPAQAAPCFACVFPRAPAAGLVPTCAEAGVIGPLPGVVGAMMALEAVKLITGAGEPLRGRLMIYDALYAETRIISANPRADCAVCGGRGLHAPKRAS